MKEFFLKNKVFLFLSFFLSISSFAQINIVGEWKTKDVIGYTDVAEYSLIKSKSAQNNYGRRLMFKLDGTFLCDEPIECPNGCSVFTSGTYTVVDEDHIRMIVENIRFVGFYCGGKKSQLGDVSKDLGIFYVYKEKEDVIRLIPSNGILQEDKDKILYNQLTNNFYKEWKKYDYSWQNTNGSNQQEIIKDCVDSKKQIDLSNCEVVFSAKKDLEEFLILKDEKEFHYVVYDSYRKKVSLAYPKE
ncbi:hypothetical protein [Flavobacterium sp. ASV13]|uniref:hypothetical protein n=1 Tax=Flavobacterium sp. ASV13 TaxID=1506583 RepID=UPI00054EA022|nr:hypothetical protein [Flavobacterium sp. ASV13]